MRMFLSDILDTFSDCFFNVIDRLSRKATTLGLGSGPRYSRLEDDEENSFYLQD